MHYIDQSGKVEQTNKDTVLALSNGTWDTIQIQSKTKRQLQEMFRRNGQIRNFVLFVFSVCLGILVKRNMKKTQNIVIDREYFGKEPVIKNIIYQLFKGAKKLPHIEFALIGKGSPAHFRAYETAKSLLKPNKIISLAEILEELKKTEVGNRLKNA
ncbi:MAG: hypothetical protein AAB893_02650 [Patescibacteria group bacterium]